MEATSHGTFSIGDVLSNSFAALFRNIIPFTLLSTLIYAPIYIYSFVSIGTADTSQLLVQLGLGIEFAIVWIAQLLLQYVVIGAITYGTIRDLQGRPASFGEILSRGFSSALYIIGVGLLVGIAVGLGTIALVIPGIILYVILMVAIPVTVVERPGISASLSRSAELTKGYRWQCFGLAVISVVIIGLLTAFALFVIDPATTIGAIFYLIVSALGGVFGAIIVAALYQALRSAKEGVSVDELAAVFD